MSEKKQDDQIHVSITQFEIKLAKDGSRGDAVRLLKKVLAKIEKDEPLTEPLKDYFTDALDHIIKGVDPKHAFFLVGKQGQNKSLDINRNYTIARIYRIHKNQNKLDGLVETLKNLDYDIKLSRAEKIHREFKFILDLEEKTGSIPAKKRTKK